MYNLTVLSIVLVMAIFSVSNAACENGGKVIFSCQTAKGKVIEVCDSGKTIDYSFGKPKGTPEIVVRAPRSEASTFQWQGVGRYISYTVEIPNGNTTYRVFWGSDRITEQHAIEAGVNVEVNKELKSTVKCSNEKPIIQRMEDINLKPVKQ